MNIKFFGNGNINCKPDGTEPMDYTWGFTLGLTLENLGFYRYSGYIKPNQNGAVDSGDIYINPQNRKKYYISRKDLDIFWKGKTLKLYAQDLTRNETKSLEDWLFENQYGSCELIDDVED